MCLRVEDDGSAAYVLGVTKMPGICSFALEETWLCPRMGNKTNMPGTAGTYQG